MIILKSVADSITKIKKQVYVSLISRNCFVFAQKSKISTTITFPPIFFQYLVIFLQTARTNIGDQNFSNQHKRILWRSKSKNYFKECYQAKIKQMLGKNLGLRASIHCKV